MSSPLPFTVALLMLLTAPAIAGKTVDRDSLVAAPVEILNSGAAPILCQAEIAHWFATDLARIVPAHAVCDHPHPAGRVHEIAVLVEGAHAAGMADREALE